RAQTACARRIAFTVREDVGLHRGRLGGPCGVRCLGRYARLDAGVAGFDVLDGRPRVRGRVDPNVVSGDDVAPHGVQVGLPAAVAVRADLLQVVLGGAQVGPVHIQPVGRAGRQAGGAGNGVQ